MPLRTGFVTVLRRPDRTVLVPQPSCCIVFNTFPCPQIINDHLGGTLTLSDPPCDLGSADQVIVQQVTLTSGVTWSISIGQVRDFGVGHTMCSASVRRQVRIRWQQMPCNAVRNPCILCMSYDGLLRPNTSLYSYLSSFYNALVRTRVCCCSALISRTRT